MNDGTEPRHTPLEDSPMGLLTLGSKREIDRTDFNIAACNKEKLFLLRAEGSPLLTRLDALSDLVQRRRLTVGESTELTEIMRLLNVSAQDCVSRMEWRRNGELHVPFKSDNRGTAAEE